MSALTIFISFTCFLIYVFAMYLGHKNRWREAKNTFVALAVVLVLSAIIDWHAIGPGAIFFSFFSLCMSGIAACAEFDVHPR